MLTMSEMRLFMMALTCASYGDERSLKEPMMRQSVASDFQGGCTWKTQEMVKRTSSMQSRRIQVALKNLVSV